jgi:hypothetical protein
MGTRTDQAERAVSAQRTRISQLLDDLEQRARRDIEGVEEGVSARAAEIKGRAADTLDAIEGRMPSTQTLGAQVTQHPLSSIALGFGAGIALGAGSAGVGDERHAGGGRRQAGAGSRVTRASMRRRDDHFEQDEPGGLASGLISGATASALAAVMAPVREELQTMVRQAIAGFMGTDRGRGETAARKPVDRDDRSERRVRERERVGGDRVSGTVGRNADRSPP